jgi:hypothetical protein
LNTLEAAINGVGGPWLPVAVSKACDSDWSRASLFSLARWVKSIRVGMCWLIRYGDSATRFIVRECRRRDVLINPGQTHAWLNAYLGLDSYPIVHRD